MTGHRGKVPFVAALGLLLVGAQAATAAPPNDDCSAATVISSVPFTDVVDVTGATTEPGDPQDIDCETGSGGIEAGVWYTYTATRPISLLIDTFGSNYDTWIIVHGGACGAFTGPLDCNDDDWDVDTFGEESRVIVTLAAGETALIDVRDLDAAGTTLTLNVTETPVFRVSPYNEYVSRHPAIAQSGSEFLVAWNDYGSDVTRARRYDTAGIALGPPFQVSTSPVEYNAPAVAQGDDGFVVVWKTSTGIVGRIVAEGGTPAGGEFAVTSDDAYRSAVAARPGGDFMVVWEVDSEISGRLFNAAGAPQGPAFKVSSSIGYDEANPDVAAQANSFVVTWGSELPSDPAGGVLARRFDAGGTPLGPEFQVNTYTTSTQYYPTIAATDDGNFTVAWIETGSIGCFNCLDAQRFDASGSPLGAFVRIAEGTASVQNSPEGPPIGLDADDEGNFVFAWPGVNGQVRARRLGADGNPIGTALVVSHVRDGYQYHEDVAAAPGGDFVVVWDWSAFSSNYNVMGRRFAPTSVCAATPRDAVDCHQVTIPLKSKLNLRGRLPDTGDSVTWKWVRGDEVTLGDLGDPLATDSYALCLYDTTGFVMEAGVGPGGTCNTRPCWTSLGPDGFRYVDKKAEHGAVRKLVLKPGVAGASKAIVKAKGAALAMPALPLTSPIRAQLQATNGECWDVEYAGASVTVNTTSDLRAAGPN